ncbi:MAG: glycosyltransferase [Myxococcota bacterium]
MAEDVSGQPRGGVAVVVPAWREAGELPGTIRALAEAVAPFEDARVVIVAGGDAATGPAAERELARCPRLAGRVLPQRPLGKMAALADGARELARWMPRPAWLLTLDADTRLLPGSLEAAVRFLSGRPDLAGVGGRRVRAAPGLGSAYDRVQDWRTIQRRSAVAVTGHAILLRAPLVWEWLDEVFAPHDYPLHVDYQMCERIVRRTGRRFAVPEGFEVETPRARGLDFIRQERRHHRAMFARRAPGRHRYLLGAALSVGLPVLPAIVAATSPLPPAWPFAAAATGLGGRRLVRWWRDYAAAARQDPELRRSSFASYLVDEWCFSLSALLGALDALHEGTPEVTFRGARWPRE